MDKWADTFRWIAAGALILLVIYTFARATWEVWKAKSAPPLEPRKPPPCPECGQLDHMYGPGGLWDGFNPKTGKPLCGKFDVGICRHCGTRWIRYDDNPASVMSEEAASLYFPPRPEVGDV